MEGADADEPELPPSRPPRRYQKPLKTGDSPPRAPHPTTRGEFNKDEIDEEEYVSCTVATVHPGTKSISFYIIRKKASAAGQRVEHTTHFANLKEIRIIPAIFPRMLLYLHSDILVKKHVFNTI